MASSGTYKDRTFNLAAQGHRQPGSAFKTMVLTTAIRKGVDPDSTTYTSKPLAINDLGTARPLEGQDLRQQLPRDHDLPRATLSSDNTVYAQLILDLGPEGRLRDRQADGDHDEARLLPGRGPRRAHAAASRPSRWRTPTPPSPRRHAQPAQGIRKVVFPDGKTETLAGGKGKRVLTDGEAYEVTEILKMNVTSAPARRPDTAVRRPARPAPPTSSRTPGSWATRPGSRPRSGSATRTPAWHMPGAQGGTYPARSGTPT